MLKSVMTMLCGASALLASAQCTEQCASSAACPQECAPVRTVQERCVLSEPAGRPAAPEWYTSDPLEGLELTAGQEKSVREALTERGEKRSELNRRYQAELLRLQEKYRRENEKMNSRTYRKVRKEMTQAQYDEFLRKDAKWPVNDNTFDGRKDDSGKKGTLEVKPGPPPVLMTK